MNNKVATGSRDVVLSSRGLDIQVQIVVKAEHQHAADEALTQLLRAVDQQLQRNLV